MNVFRHIIRHCDMQVFRPCCEATAGVSEDFLATQPRASRTIDHVRDPITETVRARVKAL